MTVDLSTYGVTVEDVVSRFSNLSVTDSSSPSRADVERMITRRAHMLSAELSAMGVVLPEDLDAPHLAFCQQIVETGAAILLARARGRGSDAMTEAYAAELTEMMQTLRRSPRRSGQAPSAPDAPTVSRAPRPAHRSDVAARMGQSPRGL